MTVATYAVLLSCLLATAGGFRLPLGSRSADGLRKDARHSAPEAARAAVLASLLAAQIAVAPAHAAIPTYDDYVGQEGGSVKRQAQNINKMAATKDENAGGQGNAGLPSSLREAANAAVVALDGIDKLIESESWEDARARLAKPAVTQLGIRISPSRAQVTPLGPFAAMDCKGDCDGALMEARSSIQQLEEYCFSHRIMFFNSEDKGQILRLQEETGGPKLDINEPLGLLQAARESLSEIREGAL